MATYIIFSNPIVKDKYYELITMPEDEIKNMIKDVIADVYTINYNNKEDRFIVIKDGNHRIAVYLRLAGEMHSEIDDATANDILNQITIRSEKEIGVKEFLYFKQLCALQQYVTLHDRDLVFSNETLTKCIDKKLIPAKISKEVIPFYYVYICSDQTEGCGGYLKALLSITEDGDVVACSFQTIEYNTGASWYGSEDFDTKYAGCDGDSYLFDNKMILFRKEYKNGSLFLNSDNEKINELFNPLLTIGEKEEDGDCCCYKRLLLDVFDSKFSDSVRFDGKIIPYGLSIFVGDFCWGAPI